MNNDFAARTILKQMTMRGAINTLVKCLIKLSYSLRYWDLKIEAALYAYRISRNNPLGLRPFFVLYLRKAIAYEVNTIITDDKTIAVNHHHHHEKQKGVDKLLESKKLYHDKAKANIEKTREAKKSYDAMYHMQQTKLHQSVFRVGVSSFFAYE